MSEASRDPVTPWLSAPAGARSSRRRVARSPHNARGRGGRQGKPQRLPLLVRQRAIGRSVRDALRVDPGAGSRMETAEDETGPAGIGQGEREALVPARVLEGVEPDETDALHSSPSDGFEYRRPRRQVVDLGGNRIDTIEMGVEHAMQTRPVDTPGDGVEPATQATDLARDQQQEEKQDEDGRSEPDHGRTEHRRHGGIEVDRGVLRTGGSGDAAGRV
jgi:hypothetical protein